MVEALRHESFYVTGTWIDEELGVYVGWVARRNSFSDGMPLRNERGDVVLVFAGEEFPEPGTELRLKNGGHKLAPVGSSYLAYLYEEDPLFPRGLNGKFHGLLIDRTRGTAMLFNDRYGMNRVFYHESKDAFYFAAEAKAILIVHPELRRMDPRGIGEFIACGAVLENRTLFQRIQVLPQASAWTFRSGVLEAKDTYFHPREWEEQEKLDPESYYRELRDAFSQNLPRYFNGPERIAMSLTGGLDTRMIMAWQRCPPGSLPCYTFGGMFRDSHDVKVSRKVASMCEQSHQAIPLGSEFIAKFAHYAERAIYIADGGLDVSRVPDLYLNERARTIAPVRMTGDYGGEVLRGVGRLKARLPMPGLFNCEFDSYIRQAVETHAELVRGNQLSFTVFKQAPWDYQGVVSLEQTQLALRTPFFDNNLVRTVFRAPQSILGRNDDSLRLISDGKKELLQIPTDRGLAGHRGLLSRAACRNFLDFQFKAEYAYDMGMPQSVAQIDHAFSAFHLERLFLGRHKVTHFRVWYRDALAGYVREMLLDECSLSRPYIDRKGLEALVLGHLKGNRNHTNEIHKVLTLELFHRIFLNLN
ncbi:MAG: asparagine synthase-related protein [Candidatus Acidiferrales bacterium]